MDNSTDDQRAADDASQKRRTNIYEIIATVLLGVATVTIAWSANQSSLWGGSQDKLLAESVRVSNESVDSFQQGDSVRQLDQLLFVELLIQVDDSESEEITEIEQQIINNLSPAGGEVVALWADGETEFPFAEEAYLEALFADGQALSDQSDALYADAVQSNTNGDRYVLASTLMATVLFFAGISVVLNGDRVRRALLAVASLALTGSVVYMLTLPIA